MAFLAVRTRRSGVQHAGQRSAYSEISRAGTEGAMVSSLICDRWLLLGLETLSISRCLNRGCDGVLFNL